MAEHTKIEWCDHTFNPWIGCTKVSPGCENCYAETLMDTRYGRVKWGRGQLRQRTSAANWKQPLRWNDVAQWAEAHHDIDAALGKAVGPYVRPRVFCASLADWLDDEVPIEWLADLLDLIRHTPNLDWLLLTKRPENWRRRVKMAGEFVAGRRGPWDIALVMFLANWLARSAPPNIWVGTTVEDQARADERIPALLSIPARVRFLSCEPLLEEVNLDFGAPRHRTFDSYHAEIHWVICGGESGPGARPMHPDWARSLRDQCAMAGVRFFFKQWGEYTPGENLTLGGRLSCAWYVGDGRWQFGTQTDKQSENCHADDSPDVYRVGKNAAGRMLDGVEHNAFPEVRHA